LAALAAIAFVWLGRGNREPAAPGAAVPVDTGTSVSATPAVDAAPAIAALPDASSTRLAQNIPIAFDSRPSGATVMIDGAVACRTPCTKRFPRGEQERKVTFRKRGYKTVTRRFVAAADAEVAAVLHRSRSRVAPDDPAPDKGEGKAADPPAPPEDFIAPGN
jgi:hypothetical protein